MRVAVHDPGGRLYAAGDGTIAYYEVETSRERLAKPLRFAVPVRGQPCDHIRIGDLASSTLVPDGVPEDDSNSFALHGFDNINQSVSVRDFFGGLLGFQLSKVR
jgi:hypothetical protein